jgi:hypothetical protein
VFTVCLRLNFRDRLRISPEIPYLNLGVLDLGRVQGIEGIEKTAIVVM